MSHEQRTINLIEADELRMRALRAAKSLRLPDWLIAAGFVRNIIWSSIFSNDVELNDIDLIYYCTSNVSAERDSELEQELLSLEPELPWSVKNQARMHARNMDAQYKNTLDAMAHWPEKQTAIGVMLDQDNNIVVKHSFDLALQFNGQINHNPAMSVNSFKERVASKGWLKIWPALEVKT